MCTQAQAHTQAPACTSILTVRNLIRTQLKQTASRDLRRAQSLTHNSHSSHNKLLGWKTVLRIKWFSVQAFTTDDKPSHLRLLSLDFEGGLKRWTPLYNPVKSSMKNHPVRDHLSFKTPFCLKPFSSYFHVDLCQGPQLFKGTSLLKLVEKLFYVWNFVILVMTCLLHLCCCWSVGKFYEHITSHCG